MWLSLMLADPESRSAEGGLGSLHAQFQADPRLAGRIVLEYRADSDRSLGVVQELIAPVSDLGADALRALPAVVIVWINQRRSDLKLRYQKADGTTVEVEINRLKDPEGTLREVMKAISPPER